MRSRTLLPALALLLVASCATTSTRFVDSWRAPDVPPLAVAGRRVVALFMSPNATQRRLAEDAMVRELAAQGAIGVPAYDALGPAVTDEEQVRARLAGLGYSGMVVMRVVGQETRYRHEPGVWWNYPHYRRLWRGYWGWGWRQVHEVDYLVAERLVSMETLVYSLDRGALVWAGVSRTFNPARIESFVAEVAREATNEMVAAGVLAPSNVAGRPPASR